MSKLFTYIEKLVAERFFGTVTLGFKDGKVCFIKVEKHLKLTDF